MLKPKIHCEIKFHMGLNPVVGLEMSYDKNSSETSYTGISHVEMEMLFRLFTIEG